MTFVPTTGEILLVVMAVVLGLVTAYVIVLREELKLKGGNNK